MTLSDRSLGWFRHLDRTLRAGDGPEPADPTAIAFALGLLARRTPAWTERSVALLDLLIARHRTRSGDDPAAAPTGLVLLGVRSLLDGPSDALADQPGDGPDSGDDDGAGAVTGDGVPATHTGLALHVAGTWPGGSGSADADPAAIGQRVLAGLGLLLHDRRHGTDLHARTFLPWWERAGRAALAAGPASDAAVLAHLAPQVPDEARTSFDTLAASTTPAPPDARTTGFTLLLAREWERSDLAAATAAVAEAHFEAVTDPERGEFHRAVGAGNAPGSDAALAAADVAGPGRWAALFERAPTAFGYLVDVDFPAVALRRAEWTRDCLVLRIDVVQPEPGRTTSFRLVDTEPRIWCMTGIDRVSTEVTGHGVIVRIPMNGGDLEFTPGSY